jgi:hypothetical protein
MQIRERKQGSFRRRKKTGKQKKNEYYKYIKAQLEVSIRLNCFIMDSNLADWSQKRQIFSKELQNWQ